MDNVEHCPCCGKRAELEYDKATGFYRIVCTNAACRLRTGTYRGRGEALKRWNRRQDNATIKELRDEITMLNARISDFKRGLYVGQ